MVLGGGKSTTGNVETLQYSNFKVNSFDFLGLVFWYCSEGVRPDKPFVLG